jgi:hypothetical protein
MLIHPTADRLRVLYLRAMAEAYLAQQQDQATLSLDFDTRLGLLVDAEILSRENRKLARYLKEAKLRIAQAALEHLDYAPRRELDRALMRQLATGRWILDCWCRRRGFRPGKGGARWDCTSCANTRAVRAIGATTPGGADIAATG